MKKLFTTLILMVFMSCGLAFAQQDTILLSELPETVHAIELKGLSYLQTSDTINVKQIQSFPFRKNTDKGPFKPHTAYWTKFIIKNDADTSTNLYCNTGNAQYANLYVVDAKGHILQSSSSGLYMPTNETEFNEVNNYVVMKLGKKEMIMVLLRLYNRTNREIKTNFRLERENVFLKNLLKRKAEILNETFIIIVFCSALSFLLLFMLFTYIKNKQRVYLYYCLYLLGAIIYSSTRLHHITLIGYWINYFPFIRTLLNEPSQFLFFASYNLFAIELLNIKDRDPKLYKIVRFITIIYILYAICHFCLIAITGNVVMRDKLFFISRVILFPLNAGLIIRTMFTLRSPIYKYFLTGVLIYFFGAMLAAYSDYLFRTTGSFYGNYFTAANIFQIGIMIEALCFAFAIGYRTKLLDEESKRIIEQTNIRLEEKVRERTKEVLAYQQQLESQKQAELRLQYQKKISDIENVALRAQMNPHFLFNSLNAIKFFILSNQNKLAANYLNRFSKLIRLILEHSKESLISLEDELTALKLYLEIESTRFDDYFSYEIVLEDGIQAEAIMIPPLLLQPFAENAIWHGLLLKKKGEKQLSVQISSKNNQYHFIIEDNGIGRARSAKIKQNHKSEHRSFGTQITQDRVDLFNYNNEAKMNIEYIDLPDDSGTRVYITYQL